VIVRIRVADPHRHIQRLRYSKVMILASPMRLRRAARVAKQPAMRPHLT